MTESTALWPQPKSDKIIKIIKVLLSYCKNTKKDADPVKQRIYDNKNRGFTSSHNYSRAY